KIGDQLVDLHDRRVAQARRGLRFTAEPLALVGRLRRSLADALDRHPPLQELVPGEEDLSHAAVPQGALQAVVADPVRRLAGRAGTLRGTIELGRLLRIGPRLIRFRPQDVFAVAQGSRLPFAPFLSVQASIIACALSLVGSFSRTT